MTDIIKLLPDSVANQIAAGEVIQRPASAVKELLENAVDAGASQIDLIVREAGKTLIQVIDNGCGMSETDARMSFERHATSKISKADDLFAIRTKGFRGEALASIAAIAQVELKTRRLEDEWGTMIHIEGSVLTEQQICQCAAGTNIAIKNLFFNVPARRNFLKSPQAELRHILDEFFRVSLIHPDIGFVLVHNDKELYHLYCGNQKQRIVALFGQVYNERLLPVYQKTDIISIEGFVGKPEFSRKTRGEQYFFVNRRFIKHPYLHHAIENAFQELLPKDNYPSYFLNISIDPAEIDVNIHPTKTEVNFQDTKLVYAMLHGAVRKSIGQHNLTPTLDFDLSPDHGIDFGDISRADRPLRMPSITVNKQFNPFHGTEHTTAGPSDWRVFFDSESAGQLPEERATDEVKPAKLDEGQDNRPLVNNFMQIQQSYILTRVRSGIMLIDQHLAHARILYERFMLQLNEMKSSSQQELFPVTIQLNPADASLLKELLNDLGLLGFNIGELGTQSFVIHGTPAGFDHTDPMAQLETILENFKRNQVDLQLDKKLNLAKTIALNMALKANKPLTEQEMSALVDELFACQVPDTAPDGRKILAVIPLKDLLLNLK
ncbi:MAG: DNA mismatch repair endonuclease MutL [Bacteroidales bacterium]|nr:DNA mismatch repair endonuclease MutL [Bacteroidales bacterium]